MDERVKEIRDKWNYKKGEYISYNYVETVDYALTDIKYLLSHIKELETAIEKVLLWRNFDGDGISDPLREALRKLVSK